MIRGARSFLTHAVVTGFSLCLLALVAGVAAWQLGTTVSVPGIAKIVAAEENGMSAFYVTPHWLGIALWTAAISVVVMMLRHVLRHPGGSAEK